mmetsp:Transcript_23616/g.56026  ORF Transcript_23616/g.56026 Transcript_23616/m.56026 type:complete len:295 (-) Transcript_23616:312-1196(-)
MAAASDGGDDGLLSEVLHAGDVGALPHERRQGLWYAVLSNPGLPAQLGHVCWIAAAALRRHGPAHGLLAELGLGEHRHAHGHRDDPLGLLHLCGHQRDQGPGQQGGELQRADVEYDPQWFIHLHLWHDVAVHADGNHRRDEGAFQDADGICWGLRTLPAHHVHAGRNWRLHVHGRQGGRHDERELALRHGLPSGRRMHAYAHAHLVLDQGRGLLQVRPPADRQELRPRRRQPPQVLDWLDAGGGHDFVRLVAPGQRGALLRGCGGSAGRLRDPAILLDHPAGSVHADVLGLPRV